MTEITINIPTDQIAFEIKDIIIKEIRREMESTHKNNLNIYFTEKEAAEKLGYSQDTLAQIRNDGEIGYSKLLNSQKGIRYTPEHLEEFLKRYEIPCGASISDRKISQRLRGKK